MKRYYERLKAESPKVDNIYALAFKENAETAKTMIGWLLVKSKAEQETREVAWTIMTRMKAGLETYYEVMEEEGQPDWEAERLRGRVEYADVERWGIFKAICNKYDGACDQIEETLRLMATSTGYLTQSEVEDWEVEDDDSDEEWESLLGSLLLAAE